MATRQDKNALIKCEHCGEYYSVTYRECPFCDEYDMEMEASASDYQPIPRRGSGGRRLVSNKKGGGYGRGWTPGRVLVNLISVGFIIGAILIVTSIIKPLIDRGHISQPTPPAVETQAPSPSTDPSPSPSEAVSPSPSAEPSPSVEPSPSAEPSPSSEPTPSIPADQTATGFTISHTDFSLSNQYPTPITIKVTFFPAGSTGTITWTSSDPDVAWVDANGKVSPGTKQGTATITATMAGGATQKCVVRSTVTGGSAAPSSNPSPSPSASATVNFTLNKSDFTMSRRGETYQIKISGTTATASWASSNTAVATVSADGTVTAVGNGNCTITAKIGTSTQKCIVRVKY